MELQHLGMRHPWGQDPKNLEIAGHALGNTARLLTYSPDFSLHLIKRDSSELLCILVPGLYTS